MFRQTRTVKGPEYVDPGDFSIDILEADSRNLFECEENLSSASYDCSPVVNTGHIAYSNNPSILQNELKKPGAFKFRILSTRKNRKNENICWETLVRGLSSFRS
jgi:hypothetical protein